MRDKASRYRPSRFGSIEDRTRLKRPPRRCRRPGFFAPTLDMEGARWSTIWLRNDHLLGRPRTMGRERVCLTSRAVPSKGRDAEPSKGLWTVSSGSWSVRPPGWSRCLLSTATPWSRNTGPDSPRNPRSLSTARTRGWFGNTPSRSSRATPTSWRHAPNTAADLGAGVDHHDRQLRIPALPVTRCQRSTFIARCHTPRSRRLENVFQIVFQTLNSAGRYGHWHPVPAWYSTACTTMRRYTRGLGPRDPPIPSTGSSSYHCTSASSVGCATCTHRPGVRRT